ncbi:MAG: serine/threonine protein kinase [Bacillariaceae sp.]|jgi:serine/threonine protein kinase
MMKSIMGDTTATATKTRTTSNIDFNNSPSSTLAAISTGPGRQSQLQSQPQSHLRAQLGKFKRSPSCSSLSMNGSSHFQASNNSNANNNGTRTTAAISTGGTSSLRSTTTTTTTNTNSNTNDFDENPMILPSSSPCGSPNRKRWEGAFNLFLRGKNQQQQHSPTLSSSPSSSITTIPIAEHNQQLDNNNSNDEHSTSSTKSTSTGGGGGLKGSKKKSSFSLIPGSRRFVSRNSMNKNMNSMNNNSNSNKPSGLTSMFSSSKRGSNNANGYDDTSNHSRSSNKSNKSNGSTGSRSLFNRGHKSMNELDVPLRKGMATTASKLKLERGSSQTSRTTSSQGQQSPNNSPIRQTTTRRTQPQPQQHKPSPYSFSSSVPTESNVTATDSLRRRIIQKEQHHQQQQQQMFNNTAANAAVSTPSTTADQQQQEHINRTVSIDWLVHPINNEGVELPPLGTASAPSLTQLQPQSEWLESQSQQSPAQQPRFRSSAFAYSSSNNSNNSSAQQHHMMNIMAPTLLPPSNTLLPPSNHYRVPSSLTDYNNHDVGLNLDDSDNSHMDDDDIGQQQQLPSPPSNTNHIECGIPEPPESLDELLGGDDVVTVFSGSSASYNNMFQHYNNQQPQQQQQQQQQAFAASPETKKAFTKIHNSSEYGRGDSIVSPFISGGNNKASNLDLVGSVHNSYVSHHNAMLMGGRQSQQQQPYYYAGTTSASASASTGTTEGQQLQQHETIITSGEKEDDNNNDPVSNTSIFSKSLPHLETVDELKQNSSIKNNYGKGGGIRLLKPIQGAESWMQGRRYLIAPAALASCPLSTIKTLTGSSTQSATEAIVLGEAHMTYVGDKYHLTYGKWSSCKLVLRHNYLFEYDLGTSLASLPRGIAHLQNAVAYAHKDFQDALELHFYASPCAKVDHRVLMIRVQNRYERDHWITCLNQAANLQIKDIWEYDKDKPIGTGRYASIYSARRRTTTATTSYKNDNKNEGSGGGEKEDRSDQQEEKSHKNNCALKIIDKNEFWKLVIKGRERCDTIVRELAVQSTLTATFGTKYNNFLQLHGFFETSDNIVIEMELLDGKDLFEYISSKGVIEEEEAGCIVRDVLVGLLNMKQIGIAHRDIKPANIFMTNESKHGTSVKLGDFGMSTLVGLDGLVRGRCGSPGYVAPEILMAKAGEGYGNQVDVFSAGVTLYVMLCGYEPFYGENEKELIQANKHAEMDFPSSEWGRISPEARDLVEQMLKADPTERITAKDALEHDWIVRLEQKHKNSRVKNPTAISDSLDKGICSVM